MSESLGTAAQVLVQAKSARLECVKFTWFSALVSELMLKPSSFTSGFDDPRTMWSPVHG